jgi:hypothetical protein
MPRLPKDPAVRQRRNKASTRAELRTEPKPAKAPELPYRGKDAKPWHTLTREWWKDTWSSPMAPKFLIADKHRLYMLAELVDAFWYEPTVTLAAEIRQQSGCFGLTPIDRRRLEWNIRDDRRTEAEEEHRPAMKGAGRAIRPSAKAGAADMRSLLQVVK